MSSWTVGLSECHGETPGSLAGRWPPAPRPCPTLVLSPGPPPRAPAGLRSFTLTCPCSGGQIALGPVLGLGNLRNASRVFLAPHLESG